MKIYLFTFLIIFNCTSLAMNKVSLQKYQPNIDEKLQRKIAELNVQSSLGETLPDEMQRYIASFMMLDFLDDTKIELREGLQIGDSSYGKLQSAVMSYDDKQLITVFDAYDTNAYIWSMATAELVHTLEGHASKIATVAISSDNEYVVTGSTDGIIKIWYMKTGQLKHTLMNVMNTVDLIVVSPDNNYVATMGRASEDSSFVLIWDIETGDLISELKYQQGHHCIVSLAITHNTKQLITASCSAILELWDMVTGHLLHTFVDLISFFNRDMAITPDDNFLIISCDKQICILDLKSWQKKVTFRLDGESIKEIHLSLDKTYLWTLAFDGLIEMWGMDGALLHQFYSGKIFLGSMLFAFDSYGKKFFKTIDDDRIGIWDVKTATLLYELQVPHDKFCFLGINSDGTQVVTGSNDDAKIWFLRKSLARLWLETKILPFQANLIARVYAAKKENKTFSIVANTEDMFIWASFPQHVRNYLMLYLDINLVNV